MCNQPLCVKVQKMLDFIEHVWGKEETADLFVRFDSDVILSMFADAAGRHESFRIGAFWCLTAILQAKRMQDQMESAIGGRLVYLGAINLAELLSVEEPKRRQTDIFAPLNANRKPTVH